MSKEYYTDGVPLYSASHPKPKSLYKRIKNWLAYIFIRPKLSKEALETLTLENHE